MNFEQAVDLTGYGRFHWSLATCCALVLLFVGFQNGLAAYAIPAAKCELRLSTTQIGYVNIAFLAGGISSAFLWGLLADAFGRRRLLVLTLLADWLATVGAGLSQSFHMLVAFRLLNGFLVGAPGTLIYSYLAEFQPRRYRTRTLCYVGLFFTVAWLLLPGIAWIIIPLPWEIRYSGFVFNSWRFFIIVLSLPSLIGGVWIFSLPESPKFLLSRGENRRALGVLQHMFAMNSGQPPERLQVPMLRHESRDTDTVDVSQAAGCNSAFSMVRVSYEQVRTLFRPPLLSLTALTTTIMFANVFGYLGLGLWLPEILVRLEEGGARRPDVRSALCEMHAPPNGSGPPLHYYQANDTCAEAGATIKTSVFINTMVMGACCVVSNVAAAQLAGLVERRVVPVATLVAGGASAAVVYWLQSAMQVLVVASLFQATMATANMTLNSLAVEMFPTGVSAKAVCIVTLSGRIGAVLSNLVIGLLLDQSCEVPIFVVAAILLGGGALAFLIPSAPPDNQLKENRNSVSHLSIISSTM